MAVCAPLHLGFLPRTPPVAEEPFKSECMAHRAWLSDSALATRPARESHRGNVLRGPARTPSNHAPTGSFPVSGSRRSGRKGRQLMAGGAALGAFGTHVAAEEVFTVEYEGTLRTVYTADQFHGSSGGEFMGETARRAASMCNAGTSCCTVPPCRCGTYLSCLTEKCLSARCEICPEGFYCSCAAACARLEGSGGYDKVSNCPSGNYCPFGSGRPFPCPAQTFNSQTNGVGPAE